MASFRRVVRRPAVWSTPPKTPRLWSSDVDAESLEELLQRIAALAVVLLLVALGRVLLRDDRSGLARGGLLRLLHVDPTAAGRLLHVDPTAAGLNTAASGATTLVNLDSARSTGTQLH